ncbi:hypothetical protein TNCV_1443141 [Trichonephila clavipes]|nr:hypothetical protein TNCV_1443141 [Trichonephila clavipes]
MCWIPFEGIRVRAVAVTVAGCRSNIPRVLTLEGKTHLYLFQHDNGTFVLSLFPTDYPENMRFAWWYIDQCRQEAHFISYVLFMHGASFTRDCVFNHLDAQLWADKSPNGLRPHAA